MLEGIICPTCEATLEEVDIKESLTCRHCKTDLKDRKYLDFLEYLMANGLVEDLDFFDQKVYSEDVERLEPDDCLLYTSPSPRDLSTSRMPSSA